MVYVLSELGMGLAILEVRLLGQNHLRAIDFGTPPLFLLDGAVTLATVVWGMA